jgi:ribosome-binding factor A
MSQRTDRVDELLRQEISALLTREVADPRIGFATVTRVETTPDLQHARVWVSVIGQPDERDATIGALSRAMPYIRHQLGSRLRIRRIPEFHVRLDDTAERGTRVLHLLQELEAGHEPDPEGLAGESLPTPKPRLAHEGDAAELPVEPEVGLSARARGASDRSRGGGNREGGGRGGGGRGSRPPQRPTRRLPR